VPADRRNVGLMLDSSIARNVAHVTVGALRARSPWLRRSDLATPARRQIANLQIKADGPGMTVGQLSGGNQQKVVVGKWLEIGPKVVFLDDPTRGVDVGAKQNIYAMMAAFVRDGGSVLFCSTELDELVHLCDRCLVMYRNAIAGDLPREELSQDRLLSIASGFRPRPDAGLAALSQKDAP
jgi:ribose transport system ATP-binding protein